MTLAEESPDYRRGYHSGYEKGKYAVRHGANVDYNWVFKGNDWYCSNCGTKYEQAHADYCCKCGGKMSEEADLIDGNYEGC